MYKSYVVENMPTTRVDRWLKREFPNVTQGQIQKWLRQKDITVNGKKVDSAFRVNDFDTVQIKSAVVDIMCQQEKAPMTQAQYMPSKEDADRIAAMIVWEDEEILVLNKPSGLATQGGTKTVTHIDGLLKSYQQYCCKKATLRLVHRLDRDTSGILVIAKTLKSAHNLTEQFKLNTINKTYWAVSYGRISPLHGTIDAPLAKTERKGHELVEVNFETGKKAETGYRVIKSFDDYSWFELKPLSGRTHQIRVHLSWVENPIIGDVKYGPKDGFKEKESLHLHARALKLKNVDGNTLTFVAPPPEHMVYTFVRNKINWEQYA